MLLGDVIREAKIESRGAWAYTPRRKKSIGGESFARGISPIKDKDEWDADADDDVGEWDAQFK